MSYLVIAYPKIGQTDYDWIQAIRRDYDLRQFNLVKPHITFVFATSKLPKEAFIRHAQSKLSDVKAFNIKLDSVKVVEDDSKKYFHAFLVPSIGLEEINALHDSLYADGLKSELRQDIPFIPHLGIGNNQEQEVMGELAQRLNSENPSVAGTINELTVVDFDGQAVVDVAQIPLA